MLRRSARTWPCRSEDIWIQFRSRACPIGAHRSREGRCRGSLAADHGPLARDHQIPAQIRRLDPEPLLLGPALWSLLAPGIALLRPIPDDDAAVEVTVQDVADGGGRPAPRTALAWPRTRQPSCVEIVRDAP